MITLANYTDIPALRALWLICFPTEEEEYLDYFFEHLFPTCRCYVVKKEAEIIAMSYAINDSLLVNPAFSYTYAVATHPHYRGLGLMTQLLDAIDADNRELNIAAQILVPADEELAAIYRKKGFSTFNQKAKFEATCFPDKDEMNWIVLPISSKDYATKRNAYLKSMPTLHWPETYYEHYLQMSRIYTESNYYQILCADLEGIFFASMDETTIYIKDFIIQPSHYAEAQLEHLSYTLFSVMNSISNKLKREKYYFELNRVTPDMQFFIPEPNGLIRFTDPLNPLRWGNETPYFCLNLE